jgi:uncharacterized protein YndB with AHSA1/START domain
MAATGRAGATRITTPSDREVVMTRVVDAPRRLVFEAWTNPEHLQNWMGLRGWTMSACQIDLRPGGAYRFVWRSPDGRELGIAGVYREVTPPERVVSTESWDGDWPETLNTLTFTEQDGKTTITSRVRYPSKEARDAALQTGMTDGAAEGLERLAEYVSTIG